MSKRIVCILLAVAPALASADKTWTGGKGATWDCATDPTVYINHGGGKYNFKGTCKSIYINGGGHTLQIESVDTLTVNGAKNTIAIGEVGKIDITGAKNKVSWKKAKTGDAPAVTNTGKDNVVGPESK